MDLNSEETDSDLRKQVKPVFLLLLDGFGVAPASETNAISLASLDFFNKLLQQYPVTTITAGAGDLNNQYLSLGAGQSTLTAQDQVETDLTRLLAEASYKQLKIFSSERLAALTYFFNGKREQRLSGEEWLNISVAQSASGSDIIASTKDIFTASVNALKQGDYNFIVSAPAIIDYLASQTDFPALMAGLELVDKLLRRLCQEVLASDATLMITATHGNAEQLIDVKTDTPDLKMTSNPVPLLIVGHDYKGRSTLDEDIIAGDLSLLKPKASISDLAPTIANLLKLDQDKIKQFAGQNILQ